MRAAFAKTLTELASLDRRIVLLTGDLGYNALEPFALAHPDRFINVGVAEQNMMGLATGLAEAGFVPYVYSIATFATLRPYEFIRNGPVMHGLPVRIIGVGGGFEYGHAGPTHHALEDVAVMRALPGLTVIAPADHRQATTAFQQTSKLPGPIYYRLSKDDHTLIPGLDGRFTLDEVEVLRDGFDVLILTCGNIANEAVLAADSLAQERYSTAIGVVACVNPAPVDSIARFVGRFPLVVTLEAHSVTGGIGSLVAELIAERELGCRLVRCGVHSQSDGRSGNQAFYHRLHGLDASTIVKRIKLELRSRANIGLRKAG